MEGWYERCRSPHTISVHQFVVEYCQYSRQSSGEPDLYPGHRQVRSAMPREDDRLERVSSSWAKCGAGVD